jgi:hypothetical protein
VSRGGVIYFRSNFPILELVISEIGFIYFTLREKSAKDFQKINLHSCGYYSITRCPLSSSGCSHQEQASLLVNFNFLTDPYTPHGNHLSTYVLAQLGRNNPPLKILPLLPGASPDERNWWETFASIA